MMTMADLNFPTSPALHQIYSASGRSWRWNGAAWQIYSASSTSEIASITDIPAGSGQPGQVLTTNGSGQLDWMDTETLVGPQGPQGEPGEQGPKGDQGETGETGPMPSGDITATTLTMAGGKILGRVEGPDGAIQEINISTGLSLDAFGNLTATGGGGGGGNASIAVSDTAPQSPTANQLWWNASTGVLSLYYDDGDSGQWVEVTSSPLVVQQPANTGDGLTRSDVIASSFLLMGA
jgi:hypothetical protein